MSQDRLDENTIDATSDVDGFFRELVKRAIRSGGFEASSASETYVASLLAESARPSSSTLRVLGDSSFTLMLADAMQSAGPERFEKLRVLGDGVLYVAGFFSEHLTHRGIEPYYLQGLGRTAYGGISSMFRGISSEATGPDVFSELSRNFDMFVQLVNGVAEELSLSSIRDDSSLLDVYERWLNGQSERLTELLLSRGLLPTRGTPGLH